MSTSGSPIKLSISELNLSSFSNLFAYIRDLSLQTKPVMPKLMGNLINYTGTEFSYYDFKSESEFAIVNMSFSTINAQI